MTSPGTKPKMYTRAEIDQMPTLDPTGNLEFQQLIYAIANGLRIKEFGECSTRQAKG